MKKVFLMSTVFCFLGAALLPAQEGKQGFFAELFPQAVLAFGDSDAVDSISLNDFRTHNKFASVGLDFKLWGFQFVVDLEVSQSLAGYASNAGWSNLPGFTPGSFSPMNFFINTPTLGFVEYSNDVFDVSVGRRRWAFGYGEYNMALSAQAPFYDGAWFALHPQTKDGNRWYYHFLLAGDDSKFVNDNLINQAPTSYARYIDDLESNLRWFAAHKVGYQGQTWRVTVSENMMIYGLELGVLTLMPIWHNLSRSEINDSVDIAFEKRFDAWRLYGDLFMDDFTLSHETSSKPNAWGLYLGGDLRLGDTAPFGGRRFDRLRGLKSEDSFAFTDGLVLSFQGALTTRYLYWRVQGYPLGKFVMHQRIHGGDGMESVVGFPYGNDVIMLKASVRWNDEKWSVNGGLALLLLGHDNVVKYYRDGDYVIEGLLPSTQNMDTSVQSDPNWVFSGVETVNLVFDPEAFYAITSNISAYAGLNARLVLNDFARSSVRLGLGIYMLF